MLDDFTLLEACNVSVFSQSCAKYRWGSDSCGGAGSSGTGHSCASFFNGYKVRGYRGNDNKEDKEEYHDCDHDDYY